MASFGPPAPITRDELIAVLRRNMADHWIAGLLDDPSSLSLFEGMIAVLLRVQDAIDENLFRGVFILSASGKSPASSTLRISRASGGAVTFTTAIRIVDDRGASWRAPVEVDIPASGGAQTVDIPIETERSGYFLNSPFPLTYQVVDPLPDAAFSIDASPLPATGGKTPFLDQHGKERQVFRAPSETDDQYANRIRFLVDQVSPKAIAETVPEVLDAFLSTKPFAELIVRYGMRAVREPFDDGAQLAQTGLQGARAAYYDDAFFDDTNGHIIFDIFDACAFFDVLLPTPVDPDEPRLFFNDGFFDDAEFGFPDLTPAEAIAAPIAALADELDRRRPACVRFRIIVGEDAQLIRHPPFGSLIQAGDFVDQDGSAADLGLANALDAFDGDDGHVVSTTGTGAGAALTAGDLLFTLEAIPTPLTINHVAIRVRVRKEDVGAGTDPALAFLIRPSSAGAPVRVLTSGFPITVDHADYRERFAILEENPVTAAPWVLADVAGTFGVGVANAAAVGATEELRVSELALEIVVGYG